jgi:3-hydroxyacyl-CoA dehydrogenase/enoyl-CoA hydratase/3-hydroxybutyryl-CoA epimerase
LEPLWSLVLGNLKFPVRKDRSPLGNGGKLATIDFPMSAPANAPIIRRETDSQGICVLTFDRPESGANIFDAATLGDLESHLDAIEKDKSLRGLIVTSAKKSIFIAGADLKTLLRQARGGELRDFIARGQRAFNRIVALPVPSCAAIHGACAGGGYEITLACDYRVASDDPATRIGLPETTLGLVPAWGGATRLPRLIGVDAAADVILKGKLHAAGEAKKIGLVDEVVPRDRLLEAAKAKLSGGKRPPEHPPGAIKGISVDAGANAAPARALEIIQHKGSIEDSLRMELDAIVDLGKTDATQNLIRNFFLADKYRKGSSKTPAEKIVHAAVVGAGVMGSGIAQWLSARGVTVILRDVNKEQIDRGLANIDKIYGDAVKRGILTEEKSREGRSRIVASIAHTELRNVGIIIEAASEKLEIKKAVFRELSAEAPDAILATNTSALSIAELSKETGKPERVVGLHFFNPVSRMKLIEVVVGDNTSDATRDAALAFARQVGKLPVLVRDRPGFLVNRVLFPYLLDAADLYASGVDVPEIDRALTLWGMPMGPLRLIDEIGVDITIDIAATLEKAYGGRDKANDLLHKMRQEGLLGRKSGAGFYKYEGKAQTPNESLEKWRVKGDKFAGDIAERLLLLMINEAARCLEEGVIASPEDADYGMVLGTGFPTFRGGPLRVAEAMGIKEIAQRLEDLARGDQKFAPCDSLKDLARTGATFYNDR